MKLIRIATLAAVLVGANFVAACGDDIPNKTVDDIGAGFPDTTEADGLPGNDVSEPGPDTVETDTTNPDVVRELRFEQAAGDDQVTCVGVNHCAIVLSYAGDRTLKVVYTEDDAPVPGQLVKFAIENDPNELGSITALSAYTDDKGVASVETSPAKAAPGQFAVKAYIDNSDVPPLYFDVVVSPKGQVPLTVIAKYQGTRPVTTYQAKLYRQTAQKPYPCTEVQSQDFKGTAAIQSPMTNIAQSWKIPELDNLEADGTQSFTTLVEAKNTSGAVIAWGCNDADGTVTWGIPKTITVQMTDKPPLYAGTYNVTSHFDFVSALPDNIEFWVNQVLGFFENKTGQLLVFACMVGANIDGPGFLEDFCELIFSTPQTPNTDDMTATGELVSGILDTIIASLVKDTVLGDVLNTGADISGMLKSFRIDAEIIFGDEPDAEGNWTAEQTSESWHTAYVKWSLNANCDPTFDDDCGTMQFSVDAIGQNPVVGSFTAQVENFWDLTIDMHPLNLHYGALLNYIIEKQLLPLFAGDGSDGLAVVDSYEELIMSLVAGKECLAQMNCCTVFAENVAAEGGDFLKSTIESGCTALVDFGSTFLRDQLEGLDTSTGGAFQLGTKEACKFYDADNDMIVDGFGTVASPCTWEVKLNMLGAEATIDATFWGTRD